MIPTSLRGAGLPAHGTGLSRGATVVLWRSPLLQLAVQCLGWRQNTTRGKHWSDGRTLRKKRRTSNSYRVDPAGVVKPGIIYAEWQNGTAGQHLKRQVVAFRIIALYRRYHCTRYELRHGSIDTTAPRYEVPDTNSTSPKAVLFSRATVHTTAVPQGKGSWRQSKFARKRRCQHFFEQTTPTTRGSTNAHRRGDSHHCLRPGTFPPSAVVSVSPTLTTNPFEQPFKGHCLPLRTQETPQIYFLSHSTEVLGAENGASIYCRQRARHATTDISSHVSHANSSGAHAPPLRPRVSAKFHVTDKNKTRLSQRCLPCEEARCFRANKFTAVPPPPAPEAVYNYRAE